MQSCIYIGHVRHRRFVPTEHQFRYGLYMLYLDLEELPALLREGMFSKSSFAPLSFRREDHPLGLERSLHDAVRDTVEDNWGERPTGPIRLLTGLRCFGYYFSPLNIYYCLAPDDKKVETIVAEVSNTPWRETYHYVLSGANRVGRDGDLRFSHDKAFHVSPFMDMDCRYDWRLTMPGSRLAARITNSEAGERVFQAELALSRRELNRRGLRKMLFRYPWMAGRIVSAIYYQAFRLWRKGCPFHPHPKHRGQTTGG